MRRRTANWFECTVCYDRQADNGLTQKSTELYVVDALSFGEAEETITREISAYVSGEFAVKKINPTLYHEVFFSDSAADQQWYKARVAFITIDEKTEKEKRSTVIYLVQAATLSTAVRNIEEAMAGSMVDYAIVNISETKIMDIFEHQVAAPTKEKE